MKPPVYFFRCWRLKVSKRQSVPLTQFITILIIQNYSLLDPSFSKKVPFLLWSYSRKIYLKGLILIRFDIFQIPMQNNPQYQSLIEMGCSPVLCEAAIKVTKSQDLSALLDWISENSEKEDTWKEWLSKQTEEPQKVEGGEAKQTIDHLVKKEEVEQLMKLGHSKNVAQKALLFTHNMGIKMAENWIDDHKYDPDFQEQAFIEGQQQGQPVIMTEEEKRAKLKELTDKAREVRKKREEEEEREREKNRVRSGKEMTEAKRIAQELAAKRQVELDRIQKAKDEAYKKQLLEQMRRQKNARLGIKQEVGQTVTTTKKTEVKYSRPEQVEIQCEQVKVGNHAYPDTARTFFETALIYVNNIIKNNGQEKFRKINKENKAFQSRIVQAFGGEQTLQAIGYQEEGTFLVLNHYDLKELGVIAKILERYSSYYH